MDMKNLITILPVIFVVIVVICEKFRQKKIRNEYDEMQLGIRGKGAWYGFYALVVYWGVCALAERSFGLRFLSAGNAVFLGLMIAGSVIIGYSILHDSYYSMTWSSSSSLYFLCLIGAIDALSILFLIVMARGGAFSDLGTPCTDDRLMLVMCIPLFTTILVATLIRRLKPEEEEA